MSDRANSEFWNELCGSSFARSLGVTDDSLSSLARFDQGYLDFYPYLDRHIPFDALKGRRVLEVGLGFGTVSQRIAVRGGIYHGLDIAEGPVAMVGHRLRQLGLSGDVRQGSILACPWPDGHFDYVIAIGCYHHTGNVDLAIRETYRVLKPGGGATIMVYNAYSYRRWLGWPKETLRAFLAEKIGAAPPPTSENERAAYDTDSSGRAAPDTVFVSAGYLYRAMADWSDVKILRENAAAPGFFGRIPRRWLLPTVGRLCGLDLYCQAVK